MFIQIALKIISHFIILLFITSICVIVNECVAVSVTVRKRQKVMVSKVDKTVTVSESIYKYNDSPTYTLTLSKLIDLSAIKYIVCGSECDPMHIDSVSVPSHHRRDL